MKMIAPSERMRKELQGVMNGGNGEGFLMSEIIRKGAELVLQEMLEQEATEFLGRKRYEHSNGDGKGKAHLGQLLEAQAAKSRVNTGSPLEKCQKGSATEYAFYSCHIGLWSVLLECP